MTAARTPTVVDAVADAYVEQLADLDPTFATGLGLPGRDDRLPDYSPAWWQQLADARERTLTTLAAAEPADSIDRVTVSALREQLATEQELQAGGGNESNVAVLESPVQQIRDVFDLMAAETVEDWATIAQRLAAVPAALAGYTESLRSAAARGSVRAIRQVRASAAQCDANTGPGGFFAKFVAAAPDGAPTHLADNARQAAEAYAQVAAFLRDELAPQATDRDAVGREQYALHSRSFLGTAVDLDETYAWGQDELARIEAEMAATAERVRPGASVAEAIEVLDADPARRLHGTDALREWMQRTSDAAVEALAGVHFDIPDEIRRLECRIAPTQVGGMYYTGPSDDLVTRPGRMWWSVPEGVTSFTTWREKSIVYHEGVPGHHLQVGQTAVRSELLNRWRRMASWISGHGEGWALYAERLMGELGYLENPDYELGMLVSHLFRAKRVIVDIGLHLEMPIPDGEENAGQRWSWDLAIPFVDRHSPIPGDFTRSEVERYLGMPAQAISYKVGERAWLDIRAEMRRRQGADFDLKAFHTQALQLGSLGLDQMRREMLHRP
jgi:uncharacterized protein (DUF885 family)